MLSTLNLPSLQSRRKTAKLIILYKIINGDLHIPSNSLIPNPRHSRKGYFTQLQSRTDSYKFSFFPTAIKLWNSLSLPVINSCNLNQFCNNINTCALYNHPDFCTVIINNNNNRSNFYNTILSITHAHTHTWLARH